MFKVQSIQAKRCAELWNSRNESAFSDVTFIIGSEKKEFKANRMIISSTSDVFKAMLYGNMKESQPNVEIEIPDIDSKAFKLVLKYAYCNEPQLTVKNVINVAKISQKYQILLLSKVCEKFLSKKLKDNNFCHVFNKTVQYKLTSCIEICRKALETHLLHTYRSYPCLSMSNIISTNGFLQMDLGSIQQMLKWNCLNVNEEILWSAVVKWVNFQTKHVHIIDDELLNFLLSPNKRRKLNNGYAKKNENKNDNRLKLLKAICPYMRFGLMSAKYFVSNVKSENCVTKEEIADVLCYITDHSQGCGSFSTETRVTQHRSSLYY
eukprot:41195_1